jgi:hypothetical protein
LFYRTASKEIFAQTLKHLENNQGKILFRTLVFPFAWWGSITTHVSFVIIHPCFLGILTFSLPTPILFMFFPLSLICAPLPKKS